MEVRLHGANYEYLYKYYKIDMPDNVIDFSTNTNVITHKMIDLEWKNLIETYPDDQCQKLKNVLSAKLNIDSNCLLITNGANEAIYLISSFFSGLKIGIVQPTYPEYEKALLTYGAKVHHFYSIDEIKNVHAVFLCNPNNPTGNYIKTNELEELLLKLKENNITLILDEAYVDFLAFYHKTVDINKYNNLYILRSLTKSYKLAGVRLGYIISQKQNINKLKNRQPTWSVNNIAQHMAVHYLLDEDIIPLTKKYYKSERIQVTNELKKMGLTIRDTYVNYFLLKVDDDKEIIKYLLKQGMVVRHTRNHKGLNGKYIRISIRKKKENNKLLGALLEYCNKIIN